MDEHRTKRLAEFVDWCQAHISGDEKSEAQIFLDRLFIAFGQPGCLDVGGKPEFRLRKAKDDGGGTGFADYVWKPVVLIEMKKRGEDLSRHYRQAFDYWVRLVPNRPRFVVLCNFDEFWIYDFDKLLDEPMDRLALTELPDRFGPLAFLFPTREEPHFRVDRIEVTKAAADLLANCHGKLKARRDVGPERAQRFILQMLIALFSEDIGLLPRYFVAELLKECTDPPKAFDLLGGLFRAMCNREEAGGGRYRDVPYFNGGIFAEPAPVELGADEVAMLRRAADHDWAAISPDIFGTIFQHSMDDEERHKYGGHYTYPADIMKIVGPTIVEPWRRRIESAGSVKALGTLRQRLATLRVLDPACGSGNFLYIAYREMKRLEAQIIRRMNELAPSRGREQREFSFVTSRQFFGIDIIPFAVELAKVTMTLAHKLAIDELHIEEPALPLDNLDDNITCRDALIDADGKPTPWPPADVIIGNPPFLGAKRLKPERGADYVNAVRELYPSVPGMADYCVFWIRKAHDALPPCSINDPLRGRAGLVGTQNIRNNKSREGGLDHVVDSGVVVEAVDNQPWSGEANVHVSIVNWVKLPPPEPDAEGRVGVLDAHNLPKELAAGLLIPSRRKLWHKVEPSLPLFDEESAAPRRRTTTPGKRLSRRKDKSYELSYREASFISSALSDQTDVSGATALECNKKPQTCFQGVVLGYDGFAVSHARRRELIAIESKNVEVVRPWLIGRDLLTGNGSPSRCAIDFADRDLLNARSFGEPFALLERDVLPEVRKKAQEAKGGSMEDMREEHLDRWWQFWNVRVSMRRAFADKQRFLGMSRTTKRPIVCFISTEICPDSKIQTFALNDDFSFAIVSSIAHWTWFTVKGARLKNQEDRAYSSRSVWDTFPWPQSPANADVDAVAHAGREVRQVRNEALGKISGGLRAVYRTLELPGKNPLKDAHAALDAAVLKAYGFSARKDLLKQLLDLNLAVAARIEGGEDVTAPGVPPDYPDPQSLVTDDCIRP